MSFLNSSRESGDHRLFERADLGFHLLFLLLLMFVFHSFFLAKNVLYERDSTLLEIPTRQHCLDLIREGNLALWSDAQSNGQPFLANPKNAVLYPSTWLYLILPFFTAFRLHYLIHILLGWTGLYYLCKSYRLTKAAAFFGAATFLFSGMYLSSFEFYNHIASLGWMCWIIFLLNSGQKHSFLRAISSGFLWALLILSGTPHIVIMTLIFVVFQTLFSAARRAKKWLLPASSLLAGLIFSSIQLLPSLQLLSRADRGAVRAAEWSLDAIQLLNLPFPGVLGDDRRQDRADFWGGHLFDRDQPLYYSLYVGAGVMLLFLLGLRRPFDRRHKILLAAGLFYFFLAAGKYLPFFSTFGSLPIFSAIRYPVKYFLGTLLCVSLLSAIGLDRLRSPGQIKRPAVWRWLLFPALLIVLWLLFKTRVTGFLAGLFVIDETSSLKALSGSIEHGLLAFGLSAVFIVLAGLFQKKVRLIVWALSGLILLDLMLVNRHINPVVGEGFFQTSLFPAREKPVYVFREDDLPRDFRKTIGSGPGAMEYLRRSLYGFSGIGQGIRHLYNFDFYGICNREYHQALQATARLDDRRLTEFLKKSGCQYYIGIHPLSGLPSQIQDSGGLPVYFQKIREEPPSISLVYETVISASTEETIRIMADPQFDVQTRALVRKPVALAEITAAPLDFRVAVHKMENGRAAFSVTTPRPALAVCPGSWFPGWKAKVDGRAADVIPVNLAAKGVIVPAGHHEVVLRYRPGLFLLGSLLSALSIGAAIIYAGIAIGRKKKKGRHPSVSPL